jgi:hypothetical protein
MTSAKPESLEVHCYECGAPIPTIPAWLIGAKVKFECEECRQKHPRPIGELELEPRRNLAPVPPVGDLGEIGEDEDADIPEDLEVADEEVPDIEAADAEAAPEAEAE